jgi:predicted Ser/Thr protein kinase
MHRICPQCHEHHAESIERCPADGAALGAPRVAAARDPLIGQLLAERYRVKRTLGEGGMGRVYLAEHERMGRLSAVKVMSAALAATPEAISRFHREAANASRIHQPNVAAIYDFGETADGTLYLAMEYVEGETLTALLQREGPLAPPRAAELTAQIAEGLHAAHLLGIVHRDLKPDNILVTTQHDGREWVKIVDFGIAKQTKRNDQTVTSLGVAIGTPEYMSPEQLAGEALDARTDLYSLGLVLFNMLTGQMPHAAMTSKQSLVHRLTAKPRTLAEVAPGKVWSPRLQKALDRALAPEPDDRFHAVGDFARDVRAAVGLASLAGAATVALDPVARPTHAVSSRPTVPLRGTARRSRSRGVLALGIVLVVAAGGGAAAMRRDDLTQVLRAHGFLPDRRARVILQGAAVDTARVDSLRLAQTRDTTSAVLSPMDPGQRLESAALAAGRHAAGDTAGGATSSAVMQSADEDTREIMVHVTRARDMTKRDELEGAGLELRTSYDEYRIFLTEHAAAPQVERIRTDLQAAIDEALTACNAARQTELAAGGRGFRCEHPAKTGVLMVFDAPTTTARPPTP